MGDRRSRLKVLAGTLTVALLAACGGSDDSESGSSGSSVPPSDTATATPSATMPDTPVGRQARWVLDQLAADEGPAADQATERFAPVFLDEVPAGEVSGVFDQFRPMGPWTPVDLDTVGSDAVITLHNDSGEQWRMTISVNDVGAIITLFFQPHTDDREPANTWADVHEQFTAFDADVGLLAARVTDDGQCEPVTDIEPREPRPMASIFKLYVLGAVTEAVENGAAQWSQQLTITDNVRSLPTGKLQENPDGSQVLLSQAAAGMIAISDNTAADMLMQVVGRSAVETTMADMGHAEPALNKPFITTRELFSVGWGPDDQRERFDAADESERRQLLDGLTPGELTVTGGDVDAPAWNSGVDWFGNAYDICAAMVNLHERDRDDPDTTMLRTILGHNRGVTINESQWPYVAYKGGSAPGVLTGSWYAERADGERFVYVMQAASDDASELSDHAPFFGLAEDAFKLLAQQ